MRFTWSGDYLHDAYWSVGEQGFTNVSHGCVNMSPADAEIYYKMAVPGDPVKITGSPRAGVWDNGWTMWFLPWKRWLHGSALHEAVRAGPGGSTFVKPSSLAPTGTGRNMEMARRAPAAPSAARRARRVKVAVAPTPDAAAPGARNAGRSPERPHLPERRPAVDIDLGPASQDLGAIQVL